MHYTYAEYLVLEDFSPIRHEYFDGEIYAIAGDPPEHSFLSATVLSNIGRQLPRDCHAFTCTLRVRTATGLSTYPDNTFVRGATERAAEDHDAVTNPLILVEITSNSTEDYDRGDKLQHYQSIPSLREILIVSHREPRITLYRREGSVWGSSEVRAGGKVSLPSIGGVVRVDDVYRDGLEDV
jgi:Uma2 family endonuclease